MLGTKKMLNRCLAAVFMFVLSACAHADFTFAHITDTHVTGRPAVYQQLGLRGPEWRQTTARWSRTRQAIIDGVNRAKPDFVIVTGDLTETGLGIEYTSLLEWMEKLEAPVYMIPGNHDVIWRNPLPASDVTSGRTLLNYERIFGRSYYSFRHKDSYFIMLNSMVDAQDAPAAYKSVGAVQTSWLKRELRHAENAGYPYVFALQHHPLGTTPSVARTLSRAPVSAVLYGHIHRHAVGRHQGVLQISGTSVKGEAGQPNQPSYALVRVGADRATYQLYNPEGQPVAAPIDIKKANRHNSTLWQTRQQFYPTLPGSTHEKLLTTPH